MRSSGADPTPASVTRGDHGGNPEEDKDDDEDDYMPVRTETSRVSSSNPESGNTDLPVPGEVPDTTVGESNKSPSVGNFQNTALKRLMPLKSGRRRHPTQCLAVRKGEVGDKERAVLRSQDRRL